MKSRSYTVYVVLALAALALWFVRPTGKIAEPGRIVPPGAVSPTASTTDVGPADARNTPPPAVAGSISPTASGIVAPATRPAITPPVTAPNPSASTGEPSLSPGQAAQVDVTRVRHMVSDYHTLMGENPVGTNAEIMKQMMGGNSHQATLGPPDGMTLNSQGELVDQWGTPFFFHQLSRDNMEVRSAGPDKIMWTADDIVTR